jgi:hypothetical protein
LHDENLAPSHGLVEPHRYFTIRKLLDRRCAEPSAEVTRYRCGQVSAGRAGKDEEIIRHLTAESSALWMAAPTFYLDPGCRVLTVFAAIFTRGWRRALARWVRARICFLYYLHRYYRSPFDWSSQLFPKD